MARAAEEAREEVKGVVGAAAGGFVFGEAFVAVLIVDSTCFRLGEGFVGRCDLDKFFMGGFITAGIKREEALALFVCVDSELKYGLGEEKPKKISEFAPPPRCKVMKWARDYVRILIRMKLLAQSPICFFNILVRSSLV